MWSRSPQEDFGCLAKSADFTLWSVERPRKGLEHRDDVTSIPSGDSWSGSLWRTRGRDRASGPVGKLAARIQAPGAGIAGSGGKAGVPDPRLSCVWSATKPSQKSTFPKQPSSCHERQPAFCLFLFLIGVLCVKQEVPP